MLVRVIFAFTTLFFTACSLYASEIIGNDHFHTVKSGENIAGISKNYNVPVRRLLEINNIPGNKELKSGDQIRLSTDRIVPPHPDNGLVLNLPEYTIYYFRNGEVAGTYPVAIGKKNWQTPRGGFRIANKVTDPAWKVPPRMARVYNMTDEIIKPGPENPLGKYWMGLTLPHIGIHSTNKPESVGLSISHGCIRMYDKDADELYHSIDIGTPGEIIYKPVKTAVRDDSVFLEVHKDIYGIVGDLLKYTNDILRKENLTGYIDEEKVKTAVEQKSGIPVKVSISRIINLEDSPSKSGNGRLWHTVP